MRQGILVLLLILLGSTAKSQVIPLHLRAEEQIKKSLGFDVEQLRSDIDQTFGPTLNELQKCNSVVQLATSVPASLLFETTPFVATGKAIYNMGFAYYLKLVEEVGILTEMSVAGVALARIGPPRARAINEPQAKHLHPISVVPRAIWGDAAMLGIACRPRPSRPTNKNYADKIFGESCQEGWDNSYLLTKLLTYWTTQNASQCAGALSQIKTDAANFLKLREQRGEEALNARLDRTRGRENGNTTSINHKVER